MAADLHQAAVDWQRLLVFARARGWTADLTDHGYVRFERAGSVVFGPNMSASLAQLRECAHRLIRVERYGEEPRSCGSSGASSEPPTQKSLSIDDVVWHPTECRWVGRSSPLLTKRDRRAADEARDFEQKRSES